MHRCLTMAEAIAATRIVFGSLYTGKAMVPQCLMVELAEKDVVLLMLLSLQTPEQYVLDSRYHVMQ